MPPDRFWFGKGYTRQTRNPYVRTLPVLVVTEVGCP
jgi:hypothetical protein